MLYLCASRVPFLCCVPLLRRTANLLSPAAVRGLPGNTVIFLLFSEHQPSREISRKLREKGSEYHAVHVIPLCVVHLWLPRIPFLCVLYLLFALPPTSVYLLFALPPTSDRVSFSWTTGATCSTSCATTRWNSSRRPALYRQLLRRSTHSSGRR